DRDAIERIKLARMFRRIGAISFTTNLIALDRYTDANIAFVLEHTDYVQISLGGVEPNQYRRMFGVDKFHAAKRHVLRFARLRHEVRPEYPWRLVFRVDCDEATLRASPEFHVFEDLGCQIVIDNSYGNWGGIVSRGDLPGGAVMREAGPKRHPCFM